MTNQRQSLGLKRLRTWAVALLSAALVLAPAAASAATVAPAAGHDGSITVVPQAGTDLTPFTMITSNACPSGTNVFATIFGVGFPADGKIVVGNAPVAIYEHNATGGVALPIADTLRTFENQELNPVPLTGTYRLQVTCRQGAFAANLGYFAGSITFTDPHTYKANNPTLPASDLQLLPAPGIAKSLIAPGQKASTQTVPSVAKAEAAHASHSSLQPWLFGIGGVLVLFGIVLAIRSRKGTAAVA